MTHSYFFPVWQIDGVKLKEIKLVLKSTSDEAYFSQATAHDRPDAKLVYEKQIRYKPKEALIDTIIEGEDLILRSYHKVLFSSKFDVSIALDSYPSEVDIIRLVRLCMSSFLLDHNNFNHLGVAIIYLD